MVISRLYNLRSDHPSTHLTPCTVITVLLPISPTLHVLSAFLCVISDVIIHVLQTTELKLGGSKQPSQSHGDTKGSLGIQAPCA